MTKGANNLRNTRKSKQEKGEEREVSPKFTSFALDWFKPVEEQKTIVDSIDNFELTIVDAPSGCGKSSTVLWKALTEYKNRNFKRVYLIKNPTEAGDDQLGFLSGDFENKLSAHIETMKTIFQQFITKEKLENDMKSGNIVITIPNFLLGATIDDSIIIVEEAQTMSPNTIKLVTERCGQNSVVILVGDSKQRYSVKKREDGFNDFIGKVTESVEGFRKSKYELINYVKMTSESNMRSPLSKLITEIYDV